MRRQYVEPVIEIRKYLMDESVCTDLSTPSVDKDLNDDDEYDYFGN